MSSLIGQILNRAPVDVTQSRRFGFQTTVTKPRHSSALHAMGAQSTLFAIVDRIAQDCGDVEWRLYRRTAGAEPAPHRIRPTDEGIRVQRHPALTVWNNPNPFYTRNEFVEATTQHFDLVGEMPWVIGRSDRAPNGPPIELWIVRPDRIRPVADPREFLTGWMYDVTGDGINERPLRRDQVLFTRRPHPTNPYRGIGPVETLLQDLEGENAATEFNTNFFRNGAEPGGLIKVPEFLTDDEFDQLVERWNQQHRGVGNAHRVGVLEGAEWVERKFSARDMQFEQLRRFSRDTIMRAWGFPKPLIGDVEDVNRANAEAADVVFAKHILRPRLGRIRNTLNKDFLPLFGAMGQTVEFDYVDPVPPDAAEERLDLAMRIDKAIALIEAGADKTATLEFLDLPDFDWTAPAPQVANTFTDDDETVGSPA